MAYKKTTWVTGDVITADKLNNIEEGIESVTGADSPNTKDIRDYLDTSMSQKGQKHITLRPDDFSELYADGKVLMASSSDASISVETSNSSWNIYKYELGRDFILRADHIVKNANAAGCVPIAFRYKGVDYSVDYDRLGGYYIADTVLVSYNAVNEAYAIEEFSFTETVRQEFSDSIICRDHAGEFDSLVVFGDSIFANTISNPDTGALTNNGNGVTKQLADLMGVPLYKHAVNNATLSTKYTAEAQNVVKQIQDYIASPDSGSRPLFIIEGGTNDGYHFGISNLGTYGSSDTTTIYGAIYYAINLLLSIEGVQPWQILVCTPIPKGIRALWDGTAGFSSAGWLANTDLELTTIGHAMYEIALNRQCSVINGYNAIFDELSSQYICQLMMGDDTHPTVYGSERYARYIYDTLFSGASTKEVENKISELKSAIESQDGIVNVTKLIPLESGFYTLSTAIAEVYDNYPAYATKGRIITFATSLTEWQTWQCRVLDNIITETLWKNTINWFKIGKTTKQSIVIAAYDSSDEAKQNADFWTNSENDGIKLINDAISLLPTGGRIYLRSGTYKGAAGVAISVSNLLIEGESTNVIISRTTGTDVILTAGVENITLENLVFDTIAVPAGTNEPLYINTIFDDVVRNNTGGAYDWVIAAYDSTPQAKRGADYVCTNTNVNVIIAKVIAQLPNGGTIKLVAGTYNLTSVIDLYAKSNIALIGDGYNTKIVRASNPFRMDSATDHCVLQGINFSINGTFVSDNGNKMLNCWIGDRYVDLIPSNDGSVYVDPSLGIEGIRNAIYAFGAGQTGGKIILGIGTYENKSTTSPVDFYKSTSPTGYISNVTIEGQGIKTVISRSTNNNDVVANSKSISGCVLKNVNVAHNIQRSVGNPVAMLRLIECYIAGRYVDESSEGSVNVVNVGQGRYFETLSAAYNMFYINSYPISETERWEIHIWGYILETTPLSIAKNRIDLIGHNALIEMRGKGEVRANFADQSAAYYGPGLEISVRDIHFKKTGCYNYYQNYCVYVSSDNVRFYNCIFENASSSPTPFDQRDYAESVEATAGARRHGIGIECKKWGSQCKTEFHDCIGIGSPYGFMNTRGWYIVFGSPKLFNCVGYGGGIGEFCHGIINHRSSQAELVGCIGYASKTAFRKSAGIRFQAAGSSQLTGCKGYGSCGTKYISEGVSAARVTEICTALGIDPSAYVVGGVVQYAALTDAICAEINNDDITLTPLNANTEEGYGISFWANDGTAKLMNCEGYAGSGDRSHGLHIIAQAKPTINGGYFGIKDMLQNIAIVSNNGNDMVTPIGGELNDYSKYTVSRITVSIIGGLVSTDDLFYVESDESTPQTIVNGYNLKNVASIAIMPTIRTTIAAGKGIRIYIMRNGAKINIANGKYLMHIQYNYAGDDSSAVYIDNAADPLIVNAIIRSDDSSDAVEIGGNYSGTALRVFDCAVHGNVESSVPFASKITINNSSNYQI